MLCIRNYTLNRWTRDLSLEQYCISRANVVVEWSVDVEYYIVVYDGHLHDHHDT